MTEERLNQCMRMLIGTDSIVNEYSGELEIEIRRLRTENESLNTRASESDKSIPYQNCPHCQGSGVEAFGTAISNCSVCDGKKIILQYVCTSESRWISVKDFLPENDGNVIACIGNEVREMYFCWTNEGKNGALVWWWYELGNYHEPSDTPLIPEDGDTLPTHWQPLPSPEKEGE